MAKMVMAGISDCPYFARAELLADLLEKSLPSFHLHKIVKTSVEWTSWVKQTCKENDWTHETSPLIWRELLDRGGKPSLIGGSNAFQEYIQGYYGLQSSLTSNDMLAIGLENSEWKQEQEEEETYFRELSKPHYVCITPAESPICYSLVSALVEGEVFGNGEEIYLRLLISDPMKLNYVKSVARETFDLCSKQLRGVEVVESTEEAFKNCSLIILLDIDDDSSDSADSGLDADGGRMQNYLRYSAFGRQINQVAMKHCRVLLAGKGPVNFNTMVVIQAAPEIPRQNIVGLSMWVEGSAVGTLAQRLSVSSAQITDVCVWGNVNGQRYIDTSRAKVYGYDGAITGPPFYWEPLREKLIGRKWLESHFLPSVEERRRKVEEAYKHGGSASAAMAVITTLNYLFNGSPPGHVFSLAVCSEGWYDVPKGLVFSYPVMMTPKGSWMVVEDMELSVDARIALLNSIEELILEACTVYPAFDKYLDFVEREKHNLRGGGQSVVSQSTQDISQPQPVVESSVSKDLKEGKPDIVTFAPSVSQTLSGVTFAEQ